MWGAVVTRDIAIVLVALVLFGLLMSLVLSCAPSPWLVQRHCVEPYPYPPPLELDRCSDLTIPYAACLYETHEEGINCRWQMERQTCDGLWDLAAHECSIHVEPNK